MRIPIIGTCSAATAEEKPFPAIDQTGHISYASPTDGAEHQSWCIDKITCMDMNAPDKNNGVVFRMDEAASATWEVTCTEGRITFWTPYTLGLFGKVPKEKRGKCTAGHLYFTQIGGIAAGYINPQTPFFAVSCIRQDGTMSNIMMFDKDLEKLRAVAKGVHASLTMFLSRNSIDPNIHKSGQNVVSWSDFPEELWQDHAKDLRATVPVPSLQRVANSRLDGR